MSSASTYAAVADDGLTVGQSLVLAFGGRTFRFRSRQAGVRCAVGRPHDAFLVADTDSPDCDITVEVGTVAPTGGPPRFGAGELWQLRTLDDGTDEICFYGRIDSDELRPMMLLSLDRDLSRGRVVSVPLPGRDGLFRVGFPLDEYVAARVLSRAGRVVLHAATVLDGDSAIVFAGHSGAGKSTISAIAEGEGARVLSDDRTVLWVEDGAVWAFGTPWHGTYKKGLPERAPVRAVYLLVQDRADAVVPVTPAAALAELFVRIVQPSIDPSDSEVALATLERIVASVPVAQLRFRPARGAFELAREATTERGA